MKKLKIYTHLVTSHMAAVLLGYIAWWELLQTFCKSISYAFSDIGFTEAYSNSLKTGVFLCFMSGIATFIYARKVLYKG